MQNPQAAVALASWLVVLSTMIALLLWVMHVWAGLSGVSLFSASLGTLKPQQIWTYKEILLVNFEISSVIAFSCTWTQMFVCSHTLFFSLGRLCVYLLAYLEQDNHLQSSFLIKHGLFDQILKSIKSTWSVQLESTYSGLHQLKIHQLSNSTAFPFFCLQEAPLGMGLQHLTARETKGGCVVLPGTVC